MAVGEMRKSHTWQGRHLCLRDGEGAALALFSQRETWCPIWGHEPAHSALGCKRTPQA